MLYSDKSVIAAAALTDTPAPIATANDFWEKACSLGYMLASSPILPSLCLFVLGEIVVFPTFVVVLTQNVTTSAKGLLSMALLLCALTVSAQQRVQSLSVEILGAQNTFGINYDARFQGNDGLGYRVGVGYGYGDDNGFCSQNKYLKVRALYICLAGVHLIIDKHWVENRNKFC